MLLGDVLKAINAVNPGPGDFVQDGLVYCGDCHEPKQQRVASQEYGEVLLPRPCLCGRERARKDEERRKKAEHTKRVNELRWEKCENLDAGFCTMAALERERPSMPPVLQTS